MRMGGRCFIDTEVFKYWLIAQNNYPLPDGCLLNNWLETKPQAESVRDANGGKRGKKDKKNIGERVCQLHVLFWKVRNYLITKNTLRTEMDIWTELKKNHREHDNEEIIEKIEDGYIEWVSRWGNKDTFNKSSLSATISALKNNPPFKIQG